MFLQHYLVNGTIFGKKNVNGYKTFERNLILRKTEHDVTTNVRYSCHILMKLEFFLAGFFFAKYSNIKFHENPSSGSRGFYMRTDSKDRHEEANSRSRIFAKAPKNVIS